MDFRDLRDLKENATNFVRWSSWANRVCSRTILIYAPSTRPVCPFHCTVKPVGPSVDCVSSKINYFVNMTISNQTAEDCDQTWRKEWRDAAVMAVGRLSKSSAVFLKNCSFASSLPYRFSVSFSGPRLPSSNVHIGGDNRPDYLGKHFRPWSKRSGKEKGDQLT